MAAYYRPQTSPREAALQPASAAICFIDVQVFNCCSTGAMQRDLPPAKQAGEARRHFMQRVEECKPLWASLQQACRCGAAAEALSTAANAHRQALHLKQDGASFLLFPMACPPASLPACLPLGLPA